MVDDIARLRDRVDVVVPIYHWGVHYIPELIADYQYEVGHAAVDAGADLDSRSSRPPAEGCRGLQGAGSIFHGMNDFACARCLVVAGQSARVQVPRELDLGLDPSRRRSSEERFGEVPARNHQAEHDGQDHRRMRERCPGSRIIPCYLGDERAPERVGPDDERGEKVFEYFRKISGSQGLDTEFRWDGDEVVIAT